MKAEPNNVPDLVNPYPFEDAAQAQEDAKQEARARWEEDAKENLAFHDPDHTSDLMDYIHSDAAKQREFETAVRTRSTVHLSRILEWAAGKYLQDQPDYIDRYIERILGD